MSWIVGKSLCVITPATEPRLLEDVFHSINVDVFGVDGSYWKQGIGFQFIPEKPRLMQLASKWSTVPCEIVRKHFFADRTLGYVSLHKFSVFDSLLRACPNNG